MPAEIYQIRDYQRPGERLACDRRLGLGIPTIYLNDHTELEQAIADLTKYVEIPADYDPRKL